MNAFYTFKWLIKFLKIKPIFHDLKNYLKFTLQHPQRKFYWNAATPVLLGIAPGCFLDFLC